MISNFFFPPLFFLPWNIHLYKLLHLARLLQALASYVQISLCVASGQVSCYRYWCCYSHLLLVQMLRFLVSLLVVFFSSGNTRNPAVATPAHQASLCATLWLGATPCLTVHHTASRPL